MEIFSRIKPIGHFDKTKSVEDTLSTSNSILKLIDYLKLNTPCHYNKVALQLLNYIVVFAIVTPLLFSLFFFVSGVNLNIYPFVALFILGVICRYLLQKEFSLIASILILTALLLMGIMLVWPNAQVFDINYLFLIIPFISAVLIYPKNQLHLFFALTSLCIFMFSDVTTLFSSSNSINIILLLKVVMTLILSAFVLFISNYIALYLQESETGKLCLVSEIALRKAEIKNFSGIAAHDLREPLQTLTAYNTLLKKSLDKKDNLTEVEKDFFRVMDHSTKRMLSLLDDLSIFSVSEVAHEAKVPIDLNVVLQAVKSNLLYTISNTSARVRVGNLPVIKANFNPMLHLFQNIISNGVKYQPKNVAEHIPIININAEINDNYHIIYVSDNGIGIPKNKLHLIFEPLKRLHNKSEYNGTGLGLSICKSIVEKYNGKIKVGSIDGEGSTFAVYIPIEK